VHSYLRSRTSGSSRGRAGLRRRDGRPALGQAALPAASTLRARYACFDDFVALRDRLDPGRVFGNAYLERVLG
jgi:hypothetical protein